MKFVSRRGGPSAWMTRGPRSWFRRYTRGGRTIAWRAEFRNPEWEATVGGIGYTKAQARRAMRTLIRELAVGPK